MPVVARKTDANDKKVEKIIDCFLETLKESFEKGDTVVLVGFGKFIAKREIVKRSNLGVKVEKIARVRVRFNMSRSVREKMNNSKKINKKALVQQFKNLSTKDE